ncbi:MULTISPECIES: MarR family winged helix-turn-helix transcriptional regulator [Peribacillus]|uniref:MarR family winged helix-turn-helix transcriptional regulator n=1 Tax=Peribacillus TaxID=2675229 RepID=UPI001F4D4EFA|nr:MULTISPECIES: MarR family transcriptional regulator [unclassified Peribacillus]MCK1985737.1 MarR family transcriptional regulator [Peribacillus sp. Aquil_B1]MCK2011380.1 MarR family transcriptional regulator [Peribacillus sp. Aquil_B8]
MLNDEIRELLDKISSQTRRNYNYLLHDLNLHVGQDNLLCKLWKEDGLTQVELCNKLNCEAPTVTNMVKALEKKELIIRRKDYDDKRITRIFLTDAGKNLEAPVNEKWRKQQDRLLTDITLDERMLLRRLLKQMEANLF